MKKFLALLLMIVCVSYCDAKPPSGGFRSSSSSRSSSFRSSSTRSSGWGSKSTPAPSVSKPSTSGAWGSKSTTTSPAAPKSAVDNAAYKAAKTSGKAFTSKDAAVADFKAKSAAKYTSTYKTEPATRPTHIPMTTTVGGSNVNVSYNSQYGGYGYMHPTLGTWMMYDMISDAAMMSTMMRNDGYYVGQPSTVVYSDGGGIGRTLGIILSFLLFAAVLSFFIFGLR